MNFLERKFHLVILWIAILCFFLLSVCLSIWLYSYYKKVSVYKNKLGAYKVELNASKQSVAHLTYQLKQKQLIIKQKQRTIQKKQFLIKRLEKDVHAYKTGAGRYKTNIKDLNHSLNNKHKEIKYLSTKVYNHLLPYLIIKNYPSVDYQVIFNRQQIRNMPIHSVSDYISAANQLYDKYKMQLSKKWKVPVGNKLKAMFFVNLVAHMWTGVSNSKDVGCLIRSIPKQKRSMERFIHANVACCNDYAFFLKVLLDAAHIKTQFVYIGPHIFVQSYIDHQWYTLDADADLIFKGDWYSIVNRAKNTKVTVTIFPSPHHVYDASTYDGDNQLQLRMVMRALSKFNKNKITHPSMSYYYSLYFPTKNS